jgi:hypothetical protein
MENGLEAVTYALMTSMYPKAVSLVWEARMYCL